jgi:hypothetical protein
MRVRSLSRGPLVPCLWTAATRQSQWARCFRTLGSLLLRCRWVAPAFPNWDCIIALPLHTECFTPLPAQRGCFCSRSSPLFSYAFYARETLAGFVVYGHGMFAGLQLWRIQPSAVGHAKRFLVYLLCYRIADKRMGLNWIALMGSEHSRAAALSNFFAGKSALALVRSAIYIAIWYAYLSRSERIRATYS